MRRADPDRRRLLASVGAALGLGGCQPLVQPPLRLGAAASPRLEPDVLVADDGARLPLQVWPAQDGGGRAVEPWAVILGLHGMNDYAAAFTLPAAFWAASGVTTYAYDQRGFGRTAGRGVWAEPERMAADLRCACALLRQRHPGAILAVVGESMGGAVAILAFASSTPPDADRLVLASPAVWGWREQGPLNGLLLWTGAHLAPSYRLQAPDWLARRIWASDNIAELRRMGLDPRMIGATRIDTLYGLVGLMQTASDRIGEVRAPLLYQYGAHDEIIPPHAAERAVARLPPQARSAYYKGGWHLLLRDQNRAVVLEDDLGFIRHPDAPLPSGAPPIPEHGLRQVWTDPRRG